MGPELWLAAGLVCAAGLLAGGAATGWYARDREADERERWREAEHGALLESLTEALAQREGSAEAARVLVASARATRDARRAATRSERRRLLSAAALDPTPAAAPGGAGASGPGTRDV